MDSRLVYCNVGFQNYILINLAKAVVPLTSRMTREMKKVAREENRYINAAQRKPAKSLILLQTGEVVGTALYPKTIARRFQQATANAYANVTFEINEEVEDEKEGSEKPPVYVKDLEDDEEELFDEDE